MHEALIGLIPIPLAVVSIVFVIHRMKTLHFSNSFKTYEIYKELWDLCGSDATKNLAKMRMLFKVLAPINLKVKEMEWFIYTDGAMHYIKQYSRLNKFVSIDFNQNRFCFSSEYDTARKRAIVGIKFLLLYVISGIIGVTLILSIDIYYEGRLSPIAGLHFTGYLLVIFSTLMLYMIVLFQLSHYLVKEEVTLKQCNSL
ncbi:hypothetical protein GNP80_00150 [Aliivibrio fischeri]|uniref:hypothetical protein n=1 Tax=Aliivibrio fischeri TaxID=668 RepID=UPI0012D8F917|nr:hypothetical protein [Aliivibrio fischeri]MUK90865.1 hypothetical protein [Aliivibrio fischeri]